MGKVNPLVNRHRAAAPKAHRRAGEIAEAVDGNARSFIETRNEKGRSEMGQMMFDVMDLRLKRNPVDLFQRFVGRGSVPDVTDLLKHQPGIGPMR